MEEETRKLLGKLNGSGIVMGSFGMSAQCNRVAVEDGHTVVSLGETDEKKRSRRRRSSRFGMNFAVCRRR